MLVVTAAFPSSGSASREAEWVSQRVKYVHTETTPMQLAIQTATSTAACNPTHKQFPFIHVFFKSLKDGFVISSAVARFSWVSSCMHLFSSLRREILPDRSHS